MSLRAKTDETKSKLRLLLTKVDVTLAWKWDLFRFNLKCKAYEMGYNTETLTPEEEDTFFDLMEAGREMYLQYRLEQRDGYTW